MQRAVGGVAKQGLSQKRSFLNFVDIDILCRQLCRNAWFLPGADKDSRQSLRQCEVTWIVRFFSLPSSVNVMAFLSTLVILPRNGIRGCFFSLAGSEVALSAAWHRGGAVAVIIVSKREPSKSRRMALCIQNPFVSRFAGQLSLAKPPAVARVLRRCAHLASNSR